MWECENCKADVKDSLEVCWNCGNDRNGATQVLDLGKQNVFSDSEEDAEKDYSEDLAIDVKSLEATRLLRFLNCLIDSVLLLFIPSYLWGDDGFLLTPFIAFFYYLLFESIFGVTIGKMITGTKVVNCIGVKPHIFTIFVRTLCRFIPLDPLTFGTPGGGWHDNFSRTFVISSRLV